MVLGLRSKHRKDGSVQLNYVVHVQEIKPWLPSSQSLALLWENGDQNSGCLNPNVIDSTVEFNKSFVLPLTLRREKRDRDKFQKNYLEFHLYEPRKDKPNKDQLLGSAVVNLGDYGVVDNVLNLSVPISWKKSSKSAVQPVLYLNIQSNDKDETNSSMSSLSKQSSLEKYGQESASEVTNEENDNELGIASFTDDEDDEDDYKRSSYPNHKDSVETTKQDRNVQQPAIPPVTESSYKNSTKPPERSMTSVRKDHTTPAPFLQSSFSTMGSHNKTIGTKPQMRTLEPENKIHGLQEDIKGNPQSVVTTSVSKSPINVESLHDEIANSGSEQEERTQEEKKQISEDNLVGKFLASRKQDKLRSNTLVSNRKPPGGQVSGNKLKHLKSVQLPKAGGLSGNGVPTASPNRADKDKVIQTNNDSFGTGVIKSESLNGKSDESSRIKMLEEELRETAALEAGLYSIVAEHGSSTNKVHAPARRLSRFYLHACKENDQERRVNAAKAISSGLVLVSKSCGNDVPRLTFWLSNLVMLRAIIVQTIGEPSTGKHKYGSKKAPSDWRDPQTFLIALEKVEAWMFSRIIESVWWQTLTPHMQSTATNASGLNSKKQSGSKNGLGNQQGNFSIELWKKAFRDACERLCPTRAGGHECGCLPVLPRLVMEQLVDRLDVAMFNAILRESAEEMPTDPLSDPIGDLRVLPIPAGKSSFGAGVQLKNTIGTWSRWLTDLFGIEDNDIHEDADDVIDDKKEHETFKAFRLLHALSDLMMLPFEMLADKSTRKEFCPTFSTLLIRRVVYSFVPDEFSPNPIPNSLIETLDAEDDETEASEESLINFPCIAPPSTYKPPSAHSLSSIISIGGSQSLTRSSSSVLKKSYTSDDELDELDSPLTSILTDSSRVSSSSNGFQSVPKGGRSVMRYQLLREVWKDSE
ncbi:putative NT-type C2 domain, nucleoporin [Helianthus annuus]|nr:putative NT-type C2 domain, nucleoporin [Helianthus annuus]